jgi:hypothetical protein
MSDGSSGPDSTPHGWAADLEATRTVTGGHPQASGAAEQDEAVLRPDPPADGAAAETVTPRTATEVVRHGPGPTVTIAKGQTGPASRPAGPGVLPPEIVRHGPGVPAVPPAGRAALTAEHVWRGTRPAGPSRRLARLRRISGLALTVLLLAASGVLLYLRFHHAPFRVTGVAITRQAANGCGVDVTGQVSTNGSAGMVSYQWLFAPGTQPPQPLSQSVAAGQRTVDVSVAVQGEGHGSAAQRVTLQVLGPDPMTASAAMTVSCQ